MIARFSGIVFLESVAVFIESATLLRKFLVGKRESVAIDEIVSGIIRRIDVDHLHFSGIVALQKFEDFEIVTLDIEILRIEPALRSVLADALFHTRTQRLRSCRARRRHRLALPRPGKLVALYISLDNRRRKHLTELVQIYRSPLTFALGKKSNKLLRIFSRQVSRRATYFFHTIISLFTCARSFASAYFLSSCFSRIAFLSNPPTVRAMPQVGNGAR